MKRLVQKHFTMLKVQESLGSLARLICTSFYMVFIGADGGEAESGCTLHQESLDGT